MVQCIIPVLEEGAETCGASAFLCTVKFCCWFCGGGDGEDIGEFRLEGEPRNIAYKSVLCPWIPVFHGINTRNNNFSFMLTVPGGV